MVLNTFLFSLLLAVLVAPSNTLGQPTVTLSSPSATIIGEADSKIERFNGIPFAQQPTGSLRLKPPQHLNEDDDLGEIQATGLARSCPQFIFSTDLKQFPIPGVAELLNIPLFQHVTNQGEDCLSLTINRPVGTTADDNLPVLLWIFGGSFEMGSSTIYDGSSLVSDSIEMDMPIVFVAINYRLSGFGFLPGSEVKNDGAANLGLLDQRLALEWVADNIAAFGGNPDKVTIWGESAGSMSVLDQMLLYNGNIEYNGSPLFHGAIMDSGSVFPAEPIDSEKAQAVYNTVVENAGCKSADDTLECLRGVDYETYLNAVNSVPGCLGYTSIALSYLPRPDGTVLTQSPEVVTQSGKYASVPFIIGDQEDEGTTFALFQSNLTTTDDIVDYLETIYFHNATRAQIQAFVDTYDDISENGSPFRTTDLNTLYPQFKRIAALLGDFVFTLARRSFLEVAAQVKPEVPSWSYLASYGYGTPILGTFHGSDILQVFYEIGPNYASRSIRSYYFSFVYDQDPNKRSADEFPEWPLWKDEHQLMQFFRDRADLLPDDFRNSSYQQLMESKNSFRL